jgi:hypothetical protein
MPDIAIKVANLSKLYKIGARQAAYKTLGESIMGTLTVPFQGLKRISQRRTSNSQPSNQQLAGRHHLGPQRRLL